MKKILLASILFTFGMIISVTAFALEQPTPFKISAIRVAQATNYHFRIFSDSASWHCDGGPQGSGSAWSFINESDSGAKEKMNTLKLAYAMGKTVKVYTSAVTASNGTKYCRIEELTIY